MSAILGIMRPGGSSVCTESLEAALAYLRPYGPEGQEVLQLDSSYFAQFHFHGPRYPQQRGATVFVADARTECENELFARYLELGSDLPSRLAGDYAIAAFDTKSKELFCCRDPLGVRPLYFHASPQLTAFSTDLRALLEVPGVSSAYDEVFIADYLQHTHYDRVFRTFYSDIKKVPPGQCLRVDTKTGDFRLERHWQPDTTLIQDRSLTEWEEHLNGLLSRAVENRLGSGKVTIHLSGGLDSSAIAVLASRQMKSRRQTLDFYSWSPEPGVGELPPDDERIRIRRLCEQEQLSCHYRSEPPIREDQDPSLEPYIALRFEREVQKRVAQSGGGIILSGWGGDDAISLNGRGVIAEFLGRRDRAKAYRCARDKARRLGLRTPFGILLSEGLVPWLPPGLYDRLRHPKKESFLSPDFKARVGETEPTAHWRQPRSARATIMSLLTRGHLTARMEHWAASGGELGLEYRYPLLDRALLEACLRMPGELFCHNGYTRYLFRRICDPLLGAEFAWADPKFEPGLRPRLRGEGHKNERAISLRARRGNPDVGLQYVDLQKLNNWSGGRNILVTRAREVCRLGT